MSRNQANTNWLTKLTVYATASTAAAVAAGLLLGTAGTLLARDTRVALASLLALIAVASAALQLTGRQVPLLQCDRETPQRWVHRGALRWAVFNGAALGSGVTSRLGFALWYVVPAAALLVGSPAYGALIYGIYGLTRALGAAGIIVAARVGGDFNAVSDWLLGRAAVAQLVTAGQLLVVGVMTAVAVGM